MHKIIQLTPQEQQDAELAFDLFAESQEVTIISREDFLQAFQFFCGLYTDILHSAQQEVESTIQKSQQSTLNSVFFVNCATKLKNLNRTLEKKETTHLNNNFIMNHLDEKNIMHLDRCWGKFDKYKLGYIKTQKLRDVVNLVLSKYNTQKIYLNPEQQDEINTICSPSSNNQRSSDYNNSDEIKQSNFTTYTQKQDKQKKKEKVKQQIQLKDPQENSELYEWITEIEIKNKAISFEIFTNYMANVIVVNKLKLKVYKSQCACTIF
ncbi:hypothetical protein TTHERM_00284060 (macronuclear) [Tetrahymena thermophila SB210]|uniref:Uncharacterized protein n=1 Tax=Tetrahymena thermophila (strain SB210) TaxID=312017 RepID=I7MEY1_TETTS|nr:hypothetical protein TTHERM_00284060 [Tetrahymena thermophila SB210]EAR98016.1 hypothetical protein TTHERM_00284060 [Tetrahymena thermophila SB210]|eukprot:XP_001018261.1 hypothetical protein TTHERM_00284060 [Tetrahymena thermophila SB210]